MKRSGITDASMKIFLLIATLFITSSCDSPENKAFRFSNVIKNKISLAGGQNTNQTQMHVNKRAWQVFVALMWPEDGSHLRQWETWKEQYELYPKNGSAPLPWAATQKTPEACENSTEKYLFRDNKVSDVIDKTFQAVKADGKLPATLTDQNGKLVYYEIRLNKTVFDYVVDNHFYNGEVQAKADHVSFPDGSILIKAAWRELLADEIPQLEDKFVTSKSCICQNRDDEDDCYSATTALVGFHIMQKTPSAPQWLWFTFEQVANTIATHGLTASFNNPYCNGPYCKPNSQTEKGVPNQVTQVLHIPADLQALNLQAQEQLKKIDAKLSFYQLMSAQWPQPGSSDKTTVFDVLPEWSANTTMETFAQNTSSCMGCHVMSRTLKPDVFVSGNFSFTLNNAEPRPRGTICIEGSSASVSCNNDLIIFSPEKIKDLPLKQQLQLKHGNRLLSDTYKQLPQNVGNKLHCSSCHLHVGGDPAASWWVDMPKRFHPQSKLQARINSCFEKSMNGQALCKPGNACDKNTDMNAILAYMNWLTTEYYSRHTCAKNDPNCPKHGFQKLTKTGLIGHYKQGQKIYNQKCAFCHNDHGQGRYESDTYFRPAIWGMQSFNKQAGMARPEMLARFLRWNMPYGSGGLLTDQEALDIACFVDAQKRPGGNNIGIKNKNCLMPQ